MTAHEPITKCTDIIDSRDVIERIEWLQDAQDVRDLSDAETEELEGLLDLRSAVLDACYSDVQWRYGITLIRDTYFRMV